MNKFLLLLCSCCLVQLLQAQSNIKKNNSNQVEKNKSIVVQNTNASDFDILNYQNEGLEKNDLSSATTESADQMIEITEDIPANWGSPIIPDVAKLPPPPPEPSTINVIPKEVLSPKSAPLPLQKVKRVEKKPRYEVHYGNYGPPAELRDAKGRYDKKSNHSTTAEQFIP